MQTKSDQKTAKNNTPNRNIWKCATFARNVEATVRINNDMIWNRRKPDSAAAAVLTQERGATLTSDLDVHFQSKTIY